MDQLHKRFTADQVKVFLQGYCQGTMSRAEVEEMLDIGKTRFFALLKEYQQSPATFSSTYERDTPARLSASVETAIETALLQEKALVDDPRLPISDCNYAALRDRLEKKDLFDVIAGRYQHRSIIVTSNRAMSEWADFFESPLLASAGLDSFAHNAHSLIITGPSYRARGRTVSGPSEA